jgi:hypothetical protein
MEAMQLLILESPRQTVVAEENGDGTFTVWDYSVWGPIGQSGRLAGDVTAREPKNAKEREAIRHKRAMIDRALVTQRALYKAAGGQG